MSANETELVDPRVLTRIQVALQLLRSARDGLKIGTPRRQQLDTLARDTLIVLAECPTPERPLDIGTVLPVVATDCGIPDHEIEAAAIALYDHGLLDNRPTVSDGGDA